MIIWSVVAVINGDVRLIRDERSDDALRSILPDCMLVVPVTWVEKVVPFIIIEPLMAGVWTGTSPDWILNTWLAVTLISSAVSKILVAEVKAVPTTVLNVEPAVTFAAPVAVCVMAFAFTDAVPVAVCVMLAASTDAMPVAVCVMFAASTAARFVAVSAMSAAFVEALTAAFTVYVSALLLCAPATVLVNWFAVTACNPVAWLVIWSAVMACNPVAWLVIWSAVIVALATAVWTMSFAVVDADALAKWSMLALLTLKFPVVACVMDVGLRDMPELCTPAPAFKPTPVTPSSEMILPLRLVALSDTTLTFPLPSKLEGTVAPSPVM